MSAAFVVPMIINAGHVHRLRQWLALPMIIVGDDDGADLGGYREEAIQHEPPRGQIAPEEASRQFTSARSKPWPGYVPEMTPSIVLPVLCFRIALPLGGKKNGSSYSLGAKLHFGSFIRLPAPRVFGGG
jgi:hypothetical protein